MRSGITQSPAGNYQAGVRDREGRIITSSRTYSQENALRAQERAASRYGR